MWIPVHAERVENMLLLYLILSLHLVYFSKTKYRHYFRLSQEPEPEPEPEPEDPHQKITRRGLTTVHNFGPYEMCDLKWKMTKNKDDQK